MTQYGMTTPSNSLAFAAVASSRKAVQDNPDRRPAEEVKTIIVSAPASPPPTTQVLKLQIDVTKLPSSL